jgi:uncharacterized protein (TIGR04551 family)
MHRSPRLLACALALAAGLLPAVARAQMGPGMPGAGPMEEEPKAEGAAEKAPKEPGQLPTVPTLPAWPNQEHKKYQLFEIDGYFRLRTDWRSKFNLGLIDHGNGAPYINSLTCSEDATGVSSGCSSSIGTADMRLRFEPVIHLSEQVTIHTQIDVLDNVVLGSTPSGINWDGTQPVGPSGFATSQTTPEGGTNWVTDSIRVKRAWGEVVVPDLAVLRFGRMPEQWGLGILHNSGGADELHGTYCLDCDSGDTVDRVSVGRNIPGTDIDAAFGLDWVSTGMTTGQSSAASVSTDSVLADLDDADDVSEWLFVLSRLDSPAEWKQTVDSGRLAFNWGVHFLYRTQDYDSTTVTLGEETPETNVVVRGLSMYIPDAYVRLGKGKLLVEAELAFIFGSVDSLADLTDASVTDTSIFAMGGVGRISYKLADDDLDLGLEVGYASGDSWENAKQGNTDIRGVPVIPAMATQGNAIHAFRFNPDYRVDLILFRQLIGTVANTTYIRPMISYDLSRRFRARGQALIAFANKIVSTPGNSEMYGVELDAELGYHNDDEGFFAGIAYGALFPLGAMEHPTAALGYEDNEVETDLSTAQTLQMRLVLKF